MVGDKVGRKGRPPGGGGGGRRCLSDGHRADDDLVLQHDADHQEDEVQHEHDEAQQLAHAPLAGGDGDDDEEEHEKEEHDGAEETVGADLHGAHAAEKRPQEPREWQPADTHKHTLRCAVTVVTRVFF